MCVGPDCCREITRQWLTTMSVLILLLHLSGTASDAAGPGRSQNNDLRNQTLVIGKVTKNPKKHYKKLRPIADYVVSHMEDLGITQAKVLMAKDNRQMISYLRQGRVDWVTDTPFTAVLFEEKAGAEILLRKWKKGVPDYHTIFFCRKESPIRTLDDLVGKTIAFEDPGSTTAYLVPAAALLQRGLKLTLLASPRERPPANMVGYAFSYQEINSSTWVYRGLVDAGAFNNLDWNSTDHSALAHQQEFRIFYRSKPFPRAIELARKDLDPRIKQRLKSILLNADTDPSAAAALKAYQKTQKFDELNAKSKAGMQEIRNVFRLVKEKLE